MFVQEMLNEPQKGELGGTQREHLLSACCLKGRDTEK